MKTRIKIYLSLAFLLIIAAAVLCGSGVAAYADGAEDLNENILNILDGLDLSELEIYLAENSDSFLFNFGSTAREIIEYLVKGDLKMDYSNYIGEIFSVLFKNVITLIPAFAQVIAVSLLCAIISGAEGSIIGKSTAKAVRLACFSLIILIITSMLVGIVSATLECIENIKRQIEIITPILITLTVLTGGNSTGAIYQPSAMFLSGGAVQIVTGFVFPATIALIVLDFMSKLNNQISFTGVTKLIKSILKWVIGITVTVFSIFLTVQSAAGSVFDGIFFKATKYLVGSSVPIVGNFLSAGVDMLISAGSLIKSSVGIFGIVLLIAEIIQPIVLLASFSIMLKIGGAVVQPMGENHLYGLYSDLSTDIDYFIAGLFTVAFMYSLIIMLMINSVSNLI